MQYDPVHAAPAWAAFRFILQVAVNDRRVLGDTIENLETVPHLITRYATLEQLYLKRNSPATAQLQDAIDFHVKHDLEHVVQREVALAIENRRMLNGIVSDDLKQAVTSVLIAGAGDM
ncbi:MAG: hypothetical protein L6R37_007787 [Teloschistes peruensis]|nr:MAG: hypothetical protein L6R37_007787 [Teloschistes peruensis]